MTKLRLYLGLCALPAFGLLAATPGDNHSETVPFVRLLSRPEAYSGRRICLRGFYHRDFETGALYASRKDACRCIAENSFWVGDLARGADTNKIEMLNDDYVVIEGVFHYSPKGTGHLGGWLGEIDQITLFARLPAVKLRSGPNRNAQQSQTMRSRLARHDLPD